MLSLMRRAIVITAVLLVWSAVPALAATPDEAASAAADTGVYVEAGVSVDTARIGDAVRSANEAGYRFVAVILDEDPDGGATVFAGAVLDRLESGTVLVLSETQEGADSTELDQAALQRALDEGFEAGGGDAGYVAAFVQSFAGSSSTSSSGGGGSGLWIMLIIIGGLVAVVWWAISRQRRAQRDSEEHRIAEARKEIQSQIDAMANTILEITDHVSATETRKDNEYLEQAGATFAEASEAFPEATDLRSLEDLSDRLDEARWQLDAAEALAEGKEIPPRPKKEERHACFFDPTHAGPFEEAELKTSAGSKTVRVCRGDAERLRRGQKADTRMVRVGGRRVPAPMAPRSYGGGGLDWLDVFSVVVGGMGSARSYDWRRSRRTGFSGTSGRSSGSTRRSSPARRSRAGRTRRRRR
jgi:hypothetical protein